MDFAVEALADAPAGRGSEQEPISPEEASGCQPETETETDPEPAAEEDPNEESSAETETEEENPAETEDENLIAKPSWAKLIYQVKETAN